MIECGRTLSDAPTFLKYIRFTINYCTLADSPRLGFYNIRRTTCGHAAPDGLNPHFLAPPAPPELTPIWFIPDGGDTPSSSVSLAEARRIAASASLTEASRSSRGDGRPVSYRGISSYELLANAGTLKAAEGAPSGPPPSLPQTLACPFYGPDMKTCPFVVETASLRSSDPRSQFEEAMDELFAHFRLRQRRLDHPPKAWVDLMETMRTASRERLMHLERIQAGSTSPPRTSEELLVAARLAIFRQPLADVPLAGPLPPPLLTGGVHSVPPGQRPLPPTAPPPPDLVARAWAAHAPPPRPPAPPAWPVQAPPPRPVLLSPRQTLVPRSMAAPVDDDSNEPVILKDSWRASEALLGMVKEEILQAPPPTSADFGRGGSEDATLESASGEEVDPEEHPASDEAPLAGAEAPPDDFAGGNVDWGDEPSSETSIA